MEKLAYTIEEAAGVVGVSKDTIRAHIKRGDLVARYPSSRPVIAADELREWFEALPTEAK
ncbi:helix-turn-helix domain-containing protein [Zhihengliuella halotolerans]|uniref:helix-turn-helix domain-containing protein n=1 Tax=Zhihengliuella halotolerans TaxID=370736 RepID=UPI000C7FAA51|nr:helix-turn-helix domain-containing protein [Zhihengliuella halotolerans]